jgi:hypothetical protein
VPTNQDQLLPDEFLEADQSISSLNGRFTFVYQGDGNLVLYKNYRNGSRKALWDSQTDRRPVGRCIMQGDGNLVIYGPDGEYIWDTATDGNPGSRLVFQDNGDVVIYNARNQRIWSTESFEQLSDQTIDGTHAYAEKTIERGETLQIRVSSTSAYQLSIVRLGTDPDSPIEDTEIFNFDGEKFAPQTQPIYPGSYIHVESEFPPNEPLLDFTLECWVRLWKWNGTVAKQWSGIISQHSYPNNCGFGLFLNSVNQLVVYAGSGDLFDSSRLFSSTHLLAEDIWHHVVAVFDSTAGLIKLYLNGNEEVISTFPGLVTMPGNAPLRIGAYGENGTTSHLINGDIALPIIYNRALTSSEINSRYADRGKMLPSVSDVLGCWPLDEEKGTFVHDISPFERHGSIVNYGSWMIGGPSFNPGIVDDNYNPNNDPERGHGLRLSSDDLYDCEWKVSHEYLIPDNAIPGVYVARIKINENQIYDVPFVIKKKADDPKATILVLCNTNTWLAYNSTPFAANDNGFGQRYGTDGPISLEKRIGFSCYRNHHLNQPTFQIGVNLPWPNTRPYISYENDQDNAPYSHLLRAERYLHIWLEEHSYDYDVLTEFDLIRSPEIPSEYRVLIIAGHSEYWSSQEFEAVKKFLDRDGRVIVLSGNTALWRISFDEELTVMECRKSSELGAQIAASVKIEDSFHSHDGLRGGVLRNGYQVSEVLGLENAGYANNVLRSFEIIMPDHFLFNTPNNIDMSDLTAFGTKSVGHEWDVLYPGINLPSIEILGQARSDNDFIWNYEVSSQSSLPYISNIMYWERPSGGYVFYIGSIAASMGLYISDVNANNQLRMSLLLENVLFKFLQ